MNDFHIERALEILGQEYYEKNVLPKRNAEYNALRNEYLSLIKGKKGAKWEREKINLMPTSAEYFRREIAKLKRKKSK